MIFSAGSPTAAIVPDALSELTPTLGQGYFYAGQSIGLSGQQAAYNTLYKSQLWVYVVGNKLGYTVARLPMKVWDETQAVGKVQVADSPYAKLLAQPNPRLSPYHLWQWTTITKWIFGEAFWLKLRNEAGRVTALYPMHPTRTTVHRDADNGEIYYLFTLGSRQDSVMPPVPERDVVPFLAYHPDQMMRGLSPLEPLRQTLLNEDASRRATASFWDKGARPAVILQTDQKLSGDAAKRLKADFDSLHSGPDKLGGTAVLEQGLSAQIVQLNMEEMQYIESRKLNREEVCAAADVPPPVVHILDHATFSNITEQMRSMYRDTMAPKLADLEAVLDTHLRVDFGEMWELKASFSLDEVLRGDYETRAAATVSLVTSGVMKPSEARPLFDLPEAGPVADQLYANMAQVPLGAIRQPASPALPAGASPTAIEAHATERRLVRSIRGRLGRTKAADIRPTLVAEHEKAMRDYFAAQKAAVTSADDPVAAADPENWNDDLSATLEPLGVATAKVAGDSTVAKLGGTWNIGLAANYLAAKAQGMAQGINGTTAQQVEDATGDEEDPEAAVANVFDVADSSRAGEIAVSTVTALLGFGAHDAAARSDARTKTWVVTSSNPRPSHADVDGETVPMGEDFSNGMAWPGDSGDPDETAGCTCDVTFSLDQGSSDE